MSKTVKKVVKKETTEVVAIKQSKFKFPKFDLKAIFAKINSDRLIKTLVVVLIFVFSFTAIDLLVQYLNNSYSVAIVNGTRITRGDYFERMEKTYGVATAQNLIQEELVIQGATKDGVTVSAEDIQNRLNEYFNENGGKDAVLATLKANNVTEDDIRGQIKVGLLLEKTLSKQVTYTDKDLEEFFNQYKSVIYGTEKVKFADKKAELVSYYTNNKVQELKDSWIADLESKAKIQNNISTKPQYGILKTTINIVKNLYNEVMNQLKKN